ncbi:MAG TPA: hypothetical protein VFT06_09055, partial [Flavisolibacter sp.]|nr:hypothetical protein [Flavisolibacter sp.]
MEKKTLSGCWRFTKHSTGMDTIKALESTARELDPSEEQRCILWKKAIAYADQFLAALPHQKGFRHGTFEKLSAMKIEEQGKPMET